MDTFLISKGDVMKFWCDEKSDENTRKSQSRMVWRQEKNDDRNNQKLQHPLIWK
jgi:hypothetical protein